MGRKGGLCRLRTLSCSIQQTPKKAQPWNSCRPNSFLGTSRRCRHVSVQRTLPQQKGRHPGSCDPDWTPAQVPQSQGKGEGKRGERRVGKVCAEVSSDERCMLGENARDKHPVLSVRKNFPGLLCPLIRNFREMGAL